MQWMVAIQYTWCFFEHLELRMLDLLKQEVDDSTGLLDVIQESDLQRILD